MTCRRGVNDWNTLLEVLLAGELFRAQGSNDSTALFTCGMGHEGQLGLGNLSGKETGPEGSNYVAWPRRVSAFDELNERPVAVSNSRFNTLCVCASGQVYAFGAGFQGKLLFRYLSLDVLRSNKNIILLSRILEAPVPPVSDFAPVYFCV